jgi:hypothetical protein
MNVPKINGDVYHEPFKDTRVENDIVIDDSNKHAQTSKSPISYRDFYFRALRSLVVLSFPQLISFSQFSPSRCLKPSEGARTGGFPLS